MNKVRLWLFPVSALFAAGIALGGSAHAGLIYDLDHEFSGATEPSGDAPWLQAEFSQEVANTVRLNMRDLTLQNGEFVREWYFNFNPGKAVTDLNVSHVSGVEANEVSLAENEFRASGNGYFDILFDFPERQRDRFGVGSESIYDFTLDGLVFDDFEFVSVGGPEGKTGFGSAAHVGGIGEDSGWIAPSNGDTNGGTPPAEIPEPGMLGMFGLGLLGLGWAAIRRRNADRADSR